LWNGFAKKKLDFVRLKPGIWRQDFPKKSDCDGLMNSFPLVVEQALCRESFSPTVLLTKYRLYSLFEPFALLQAWYAFFIGFLSFFYHHYAI
jgi:hypothetical protein